MDFDRPSVFLPVVSGSRLDNAIPHRERLHRQRTVPYDWQIVQLREGCVFKSEGVKAAGDVKISGQERFRSFSHTDFLIEVK